MTELDEDQRRALGFFRGLPQPGIVAWFETSEIGRAALKKLGRKFNELDARRAAGEADDEA
jgi:hypothetical protein